MIRYAIGCTFLTSIPHLAAAQCEVAEHVGSDTVSGDFFGLALAAAGDYAIVGAPFDHDEQGSAYVFQRTLTGWVQVQKLHPSSLGQEAEFGCAVAMDGDRAVVGARDDNTGAGAQSGAAHVYELQDGTWKRTRRLFPESPAASAEFGAAVAVWQDRILVGAPHDDGTGSGAAYVFELELDGTWSRTKLRASDASNHAIYGATAAIEGDMALIGAPRDGFVGGETSRGAVYVVERIGGAWVETAKLAGSLGGADDHFGDGIVLRGNRALVAASLADTSAGADAGCVYVFEHTGAGWIEVARLEPAASRPGYTAGRSVFLDADRAFVSARGEESAFADPGVVHLFDFVDGAWVESTAIHPSAVHADFLRFGNEIAVTGSIVFFGTTRSPGGSVIEYSLPERSIERCRCGAGAPCGNDDAGAGCESSTGSGARLAACGSSSVAADDLVLTVSGMPPHQFGIFFMGGATAQQPFGDGLMCVSAGASGLFRYLPAQSSGGGGAITLGPGIVERSQSFAPTGRIAPGDTWHFQGWYRDPGGPCGSGFNLSNAVAIGFLP